MKVSALYKSKFTRIGFKYGIAGTIGASMAAAGAASLGAPFGEKKDAAIEAAKLTAKAGLALTGAWLLRKHVVRGVAAGSKAFGKSAMKSGKVMFRRIGGRIVPIKVKV